MNNHLLTIAMQTAVPLWIISIRERGLSNQDFIEAKEICDRLGVMGDRLIHGRAKGDKEGLVADLFNKTAKAIAVLSFCPGGITIFNTTFKSDFLSPQRIKLDSLKELRERVLNLFKKPKRKIKRRRK